MRSHLTIFEYVPALKDLNLDMADFKRSHVLRKNTQDTGYLSSLEMIRTLCFTYLSLGVAACNPDRKNGCRENQPCRYSVSHAP